MHIQPKSFTIEDYFCRSFDCDCGRSHSTAVRETIICSGALYGIPELLDRLGCKKPLILCDTNTWQAAAKRLTESLSKAQKPYALCFFEQKELVPDEAALGQIMMSLPPDCDLIIGVGTGTLNDLSKYASFITNRPYCVVATAPSMDGFASIGAALMRNNLKTTLDAHVPIAIIGDVDVLAAAPIEMILAGFGDILGKYTCLLDWKMGQIINDEYYCPTIAEIVETAIQRVVAQSESIRRREPAAIAALMEALVLTGVAMSFSGNSRPASGCEHHLSHFLEMRFLFDGRKPVLHGRKVAVGTVAAAAMYHQLQHENVDFAAARRACKAFDSARWERDMKEYFGKAAPGVIALEAAVGKNSPENCLKQIDVMEKRWPEIVQEISKLPSAQKLADILRALGAASTPEEIGVEKQLFHDGIIAAKEVRDRFTLWQMLRNMGLLDAYADWASEKFYERSR
ncbi:MAG: sn-glycerol-1-phosphate dehydrogenase [Clostridia bacterium]